MTRTGLSIGEELYGILSADSGVAELIGHRIFPIVADEGTMMPYVAYHTQSVTPYYSKDGVEGEVAQVIVNMYGDEYRDVVAVAEAVRRAVELKRTGIISRATITQCSENFGANVFVKSITFQFQITL